MNIGVLALVRMNPERAAALANAGYGVREAAQYLSRAEAIADAGDVQVVLSNGRFGLSGEEMALLPQLKLVYAVGAGYEAIDLAAAKSRGIAVANCPDANATAVADSALMLLLASVRHLREADHFVRAGGWQDQWRAETPVVHGKRLGVLGLGRIGGRIARRASRGFDMEIGYHNRRASNEASTEGYRYFDDLVELARWADFLVSAAPGGPATRHLVDAAVLEALGPKGHLVNVGRGTVVDTVALIDALRSKRIAGAALDVVEGEPTVPPPLLKFDNVLITPHCAGRAPESQTAATAALLANLNAFFSGKPLLTPVS